MAELELISVGKLTKTHALKGALKMRPFNVNTDFFNYTNSIYIENKKYEVLKFQFQNGIIILTLENINTIEKAEKLRGKEIFIKKSLIPIDENEILLIEMLGFETILNNEIFGKIVDFADYNAGLIYIVEDIKTKEKYFLPENNDFIENIDYDNKKIYFKNIEELLE